MSSEKVAALKTRHAMIFLTELQYNVTKRALQFAIEKSNNVNAEEAAADLLRQMELIDPSVEWE